MIKNIQPILCILILLISSYIVSDVHALSTDLNKPNSINETVLNNSDQTAVQAQWYPLGGGVGSLVNAVDVSGSDVYVGGYFKDVGGNASADYIARWDGEKWQALGSGLNGVVNAIVVSGSNVYVGGQFTATGDGLVTLNYIARWDGAEWKALGAGLDQWVWAVHVLNNNLYVGGNFTETHDKNVKLKHIARWNGSNWKSLGSGLFETVYALASDGTGLYAGGAFPATGEMESTLNHIAYWNGTDWQALDDGSDIGLNNTVLSIAVEGTDVYAGGYFTDSGLGLGMVYNHIVRWDGSSWINMGAGFVKPSDIEPVVNAVAVHDSIVYAGGYFLDAGGAASADYVARWDGANWSGLGDGLNDVVNATYADHNGLIAGGAFTQTGNKSRSLNYVAFWGERDAQDILPKYLPLVFR